MTKSPTTITPGKKLTTVVREVVQQGLGAMKSVDRAAMRRMPASFQRMQERRRAKP